MSATVIRVSVWLALCGLLSLLLYVEHVQW